MSSSLFPLPESASIQRLLFRERVEADETPHEMQEPWYFHHTPHSPAPELHAAMDAVLARVSPEMQHVITTRPCKSDLFIRMEEPVLRRIFYALLRGINDARMDSGAPLSRLLISTRSCLNGYGAALELIDDGSPLPRKLLFHLSQMESSPIREIPGWPLLVARDLVETHGGRLLVQSPPRGLKTGAALRLFLPLSTSQPARAGSAEREAFHVAI